MPFPWIGPLRLPGAGPTGPTPWAPPSFPPPDPTAGLDPFWHGTASTPGYSPSDLSPTLPAPPAMATPSYGPPVASLLSRQPIGPFPQVFHNQPTRLPAQSRPSFGFQSPFEVGPPSLPPQSRAPTVPHPMRRPTPPSPTNPLVQIQRAQAEANAPPEEPGWFGKVATGVTAPLRVASAGLGQIAGLAMPETYAEEAQKRMEAAPEAQGFFGRISVAPGLYDIGKAWLSNLIEAHPLARKALDFAAKYPGATAGLPIGRIARDVLMPEHEAAQVAGWDGAATRVVRSTTDIAGGIIQDPLVWIGGFAEAPVALKNALMAVKVAKDSGRVLEASANAMKAATLIAATKALPVAYVPGIAHGAVTSAIQAWDALRDHGVSPQFAEKTAEAAIQGYFAIGIGKHALGKTAEQARTIGEVMPEESKAVAKALGAGEPPRVRTAEAGGVGGPRRNKPVPPEPTPPAAAPPTPEPAQAKPPPVTPTLRVELLQEVQKVIEDAGNGPHGMAMARSYIERFKPNVQEQLKQAIPELRSPMETKPVVPETPVPPPPVPPKEVRGVIPGAQAAGATTLPPVPTRIPSEPTVTRTTPALGTPERTALDETRNRHESDYDTANKSVADLAMQLEYASSGTRKYDALKAKLEKARDKANELFDAGKDVRRNQYLAILEDVAASGESANRIAARMKIAEKYPEAARAGKKPTHEELNVEVRSVVEAQAAKMGITDKADIEAATLDAQSNISSYPPVDPASKQAENALYLVIRRKADRRMRSLKSLSEQEADDFSNRAHGTADKIDAVVQEAETFSQDKERRASEKAKAEEEASARTTKERTDVILQTLKPVRDIPVPSVAKRGFWNGDRSVDPNYVSDGTFLVDVSALTGKQIGVAKTLAARKNANRRVPGKVSKDIIRSAEKEAKKPLTEFGVVSDDPSIVNAHKTAIYTDAEGTVYSFDADRVRFLQERFGVDELMAKDAKSAVVLRSGGKTVGALMPWTQYPVDIEAIRAHRGIAVGAEKPTPAVPIPVKGLSSPTVKMIERLAREGKDLPERDRKNTLMVAEMDAAKARQNPPVPATVPEVLQRQEAPVERPEPVIAPVKDARDAFKAIGATDEQAEIGNILAKSVGLDLSKASTVSGGIPGKRALRQEGVGPLWRSNILDSLSSWQNKGTLEQLKAHLAKTRGTADEAEWIGLNGFLAGKTSVTKAEVEQFVREHQVQVTEVMLGSEGKAATKTPAQWREEQGRLEREARRWQANGDEERASRLFDQADEAGRYAEGLNEQGTTKGEPKFSSYQLPGGKNYRELLLTLPPKRLSEHDTYTAVQVEGSINPNESWRVKNDRTGEYIGPRMDRNGAETTANTRTNDMRRSGRFPLAVGETPFISSHFDEPNVLAHVRFNDRTDANGKRTLFIEEIQSDWHQKGRREGYLVPGLPEAGRSLPPNAPFKTTWPMLVMKRMIRYAAENGYDQVAWTTGEQQAERYDLSKQIREVRATRMQTENGVRFNIDFVTRAGSDQHAGSFEASELPGVVGKELADKIVSGQGAPIGRVGRVEEYAEPSHFFQALDRGILLGPKRATRQEAQGDLEKALGPRVFTGLDLKVGGEGMSAFYDRMLPNEVNKFVKRFGGKVGQTSFGGPSTVDVHGTPVSTGIFGKFIAHSLDLTPAMTESALAGMPMFQGQKGAVEFLADGRILLHALRNPDFSTGIHEIIGHISRRQLFDRRLTPEQRRGVTDEDIAIAEKWAGVGENGKWNRTAEERFARGVERYLRDGKAPTSALEPIFSKVREWMKEIYRRLVGSPLDINISPEMRGVFDRLFTRTERLEMEKARSEAVGTPPSPVEAPAPARTPSEAVAPEPAPAPSATVPVREEAAPPPSAPEAAVKPAVEATAKPAATEPERPSHEVDIDRFLGRIAPGTSEEARIDTERSVLRVAKNEGREAEAYALKRIDELREKEGLLPMPEEVGNMEELPEEGVIESVTVPEAKPEEAPKPPPAGRAGLPKMGTPPGLEPPKPPTAEAAPAAPEPEKQSLTSTKNAIVDEERAKRKLPPVMAAGRREFAEVWDSAMREIDGDSEVQTRLIDDLDKNPRALTDRENALLLHRQIELQNEYGRGSEQLDVASRSGDPISLADATARLSRISDELLRVYDIGKRVGTETGRGLNSRKMLAREDFSLARMVTEERLTANKGKPLTAEQHVQVKQLQEKIAALQLAFDAVKTRADEQAATIEGFKVTSKIKRDNAEAASVNRRSGKRPLTPEEKKARVEAATKKIDAKVQKGEQGDLYEPVQDLARSIVEENPGISYEGLIDRMHAVLKGFLGDDFTRFDTKEAFSGRGRFTLPPKDVVSKTLREYRSIARLQGHEEQILADLLAGKPGEDITLPATGPQRDKATDAMREEIRKLNELKRQYNVGTGDAQTTLASVLSAKETYYRHRLNDLQQEMERGQQAVPTKTPSPTSAKLEALRTEYRKVRAEYDEMFPKDRTLTPEQRLKIALKAAEKNATILSERLANANRGIFESGKSPVEVHDPALDLLRAKNQAVKDEIALLKDLHSGALADSIASLNRQLGFEMKKSPAKQRAKVKDELRISLDKLNKELAKGPKPTPEEVALKALKARMSKRIEELTDRMAREDFAPKPRKEPVYDTDALVIKKKLDDVKRDWYMRQIENMLKNATPIGKVLNWTAEKFNVSRALITSADLSAVLRQGAFIGFGNPARAIRNLGPMLRAMTSEQYAYNVGEQLANRPNAALYKRAGLFLHEPGTPSLARQEEAYMSRTAESLPYGIGKVVAGSQRAYTTFLNLLRADTFDAMKETLGRNGELTVDEAKAIANYVNAATGRGNLGALTQAAVPLNTFFFAPRYVASRFQLLTGEPLIRGSWRTRKLIAGEYAKFLIGIGTVYAISKLAGASVEEDPHSADFGKIKIGDTRIDPLAGLSQSVVMPTRVLSGETKKASGEIVPIRGSDVPYGGDTTGSVIGRFMRSKFSPATGLVFDVLSGTDVVGEPVTPGSAALRLVLPMSGRDIFDALKAHGVPAGTALGLMSIFGMSVSTYAKRRREGEFGTVGKFGESAGFKTMVPPSSTGMAAVPTPLPEKSSLGDLPPTMRADRIEQMVDALATEADQRTLLRSLTKQGIIDAETKAILKKRHMATPVAAGVK